MKGKLIMPAIISLLLILAEPPSVALAAARFGDFEYAYCRYPDMSAENTKANNRLNCLKNILPWWSVKKSPAGVNDKSADKTAADNIRKKTGQLRPLIPNETGTELKLKIRELASQILANKKTSRDLTVVVTTFVNLNQLYQTTDLGRLLAEHMIGELQKKGTKVLDVRLANCLQVKEGYGEYGLSREMSELSYVHNAQARLVGTYSVAGGQVVINARLLHQKDGRVLSSGSIIMGKNRMISELLKDSGWPASIPQAVMIESFDSIRSSH
ncbi:MAG: FlgO family outer membrane protein [Thermodesulfobacteriota bacterium]